MRRSKRALPILALLLAAPVPAGGGLWDSIKEGASKTAESVGAAAREGASVVGDTASDGADAMGEAASDGAEALTDAATPERSRREIDTMATRTLAELFADRPQARNLFERSFGYAVFDTRKMSFMITTGFGAGVAVERAAGRRTYMKMATGGVNVGMGANWYKVIFLFESRSKFRAFVDEGWDAGGGGSVVAADEGANLGATFQHGMAVFQITDKGLMLAADLTGTKYWKNDALNAR